MTDILLETLQYPDDIMVIGVEGSLDNTTLDEFEGAIRKINAEGVYRLVFDLSRLSIITSPGIGALVKIMNTCRENYGNIIIVSPRPAVRDALQLFGLFNFIIEEKDVNSALKVFTEPPKK
jgi:anti-anti-sigma factor